MAKTSGKAFLVCSQGILHGVPVFPDSTKNLRAIVVGASGTSGEPVIDVLSSNPQRWQKVYALSRKPPVTTYPSHVEHLPVDLLWEPEKMSEFLSEHEVQA